LVFMRAVAVDGTKIVANASKKSLYDETRILREAEAVDAAEDEEYGESNGRELPEDLADKTKRKAKLEEIARRLRMLAGIG